MRAVKLGDATMSVLEIWGAEYQENDCLLIKPDARPLLEAICERERCSMQVRPGRAVPHICHASSPFVAAVIMKICLHLAGIGV